MIRNLAAARSDAPCQVPAAAFADAHVVVLTSFLGPHHLQQMREFRKRVRRLTILVSTVMEPNRDWAADWEGLDVRVQKCWMVTRRWQHASGFAEDTFVHLPRDTGRQLRSLQPDVILSFEMGFRTLFSALYRARHPNCRLVMVCNISDHTESGRGRLRGVLRHWLRSRVDLVTSNGPGCTRYLRSLGYSPAGTLPYHYCHDAGKVFQGKRSFTGPPRRLFYCGSLTGRKGILPFVRELAAWCRRHPERQIELTLAGRGPLDEVIRSVERPANLQLAMPGSVDAKAIRDQYGQSDLMVFPTLADEWGLVVNESMASGTPVLGSTLAQAVEVLCIDGVNSWLFDPRRPDAVQAAIDRAMNTPAAELARMSDAARAAVAGIDIQSSGDEFSAIVHAALALRSDRDEARKPRAAGN